MAILSGSAVHVKGLGSACLGEESVDGSLEIDDGAENPTFQSSPGQLGEEALDGIEPGA